jgi:hypothetical protein
LHSSTYIKYPFSLAIFEDKLYWADVYQKGVFVMNKFNGTEVRQVKLFFFTLSFTSSIYYVLRPMNFCLCFRERNGDFAFSWEIST